jgi:hypothetical protein
MIIVCDVLWLGMKVFRIGMDERCGTVNAEGSHA